MKAAFRRVTQLRTYSSSPASSPVNSSLPPQPILDYQYLIHNRATCAKNLIHRKSHLTSDAIDDVAYLYTESRNLSRKLTEARARQNTLGEKIKAVVMENRSSKATSEVLTGHQKAFDHDPHQPPLEFSESVGPGSRTMSDLSQRSNLIHAAQLQTYHAEAALLKESIASLSKDATALDHRLLCLAIQLPNATHPDVQIGPYEHSQVVTSSAGAKLASEDLLPFTSFNEPACAPDPDRDHLKLLTDLGWLSFAHGLKSTGPSFPVLIGPGALLELALSQYALSLAIEAGWKLVIGPDLVRTELSDRCGFSPRDGGEANQTYFVSSTKNLRRMIDPDSDEKEILPSLCLSATAEIPLVASHHSTTFPNANHPDFPDQPIKLVSIGNAFRAEAGARGAESRGLYRVHQFRKVELVAMTRAEEAASEQLLKEMVELQVKVIEGLGLPYRVLEMSSEELGGSAFHKFDIEAWMPGRGRWGEVSSASNCTDYQSRRLGIRYRQAPNQLGSKKQAGKALYAHTLNATAAAMPRLMVSLVENGVQWQDKAIRIQLPSVLQRFWLGDDRGIKWV
ncbi:hypothetical protein CROQUDRAFT_651187 [Cronartium quercuum f. sp. fusiforme G11]|uniref:serine--tRNA ligase n=1 Tax=Cronartium quercuum f. sp. fusiforme G11 TaxID=708437 RepID=A0A9P6NW16_9BASI|nr:hypothetical protein CROQUDRAFT_651187 [Cronartium quercuum f. sp. fusiforme G11]